MSQMHRAASIALALLTLASFVSRTSAQSAQRDSETPPTNADESAGTAFPLRLTERPLTLPKGKIALTSSLGVEYLSFEEPDECVMTLSGVVCLGEGVDYDHDQWGTSAGVSVGVIDALEIGLVPLRLREGFTPEGEGRFVRDPLFYVQAAPLRRELLQLGLGYQVLLPFRSDTTVMTQSVSLDLLARSRFVRGEASAFVRFDHPVRRRTSYLVSERMVTPGLAARVTGQVADPFAVFFGFQSSFFDSSIDGHVTNISTGFVGTVRRSTGEPVADIRFTFGALDLRRIEDPLVAARGDTRGGDDLPCELAVLPDDVSGSGERCGVVPGVSKPVRRFTFEVSAVFYFHDAW